MPTTKIILNAWRYDDTLAYIKVTTPVGIPFEVTSIEVYNSSYFEAGSISSYSTYTEANTQINTQASLLTLKYIPNDFFSSVQVKIILEDSGGTTTARIETVKVPGSNSSLETSLGGSIPSGTVMKSHQASPYCGNMGGMASLSAPLTYYTSGVQYDIPGASNLSDRTTWYNDLIVPSGPPNPVLVTTPNDSVSQGYPSLRGVVITESVSTTSTMTTDVVYEWLTLNHDGGVNGKQWWGGLAASYYVASTVHSYSDIYTDLDTNGVLSQASQPFVVYGKFIATDFNFNKTCPVAPTLYTYSVCSNTDTTDCTNNTIPVSHRAPSGAAYIAGNVTFNVNQCCPVGCAAFSVSTSTTPKNGWSNSGTITVTPTGGLEPYIYILSPAAPLQINPSPTQDDTTCDTTLNSNIITCNSNNVIAPGMNISGAGIPANAWVLWVDTPGAVTQFSMATGVISFPTMALATAAATGITATFTPGAFHVFGGMGATTHSAANFDANSCGSSSVVTVSATQYTQGCTDPTATNYSSTATVDCNGDITVDPTYVQAAGWDSCCIPQVSGCTDPNAINYNSLATLDDGSCTYPTPGCTDPTATNYVATADIDDGSCVYPSSSCVPASINSLISKTGKCLDYKGDKTLIQIQTGLIDDCSTKTTWTLILIHYLLSKIGLPCIYNCQDYETQDPTTNNIYTDDYLDNFINFVNKNCDSCFGTNDNNAGPPPRRGGTMRESGTTAGGTTITINGITYNI